MMNLHYMLREGWNIEDIPTFAEKNFDIITKRNSCALQMRVSSVKIIKHYNVCLGTRVRNRSLNSLFIHLSVANRP